MSPKKWSKNTFGWARAEVLGALINAVFLLALCFSILIESFKRFVDPESLHDPMLILCVGILGLCVNLIGLFLFHGLFAILDFFGFFCILMDLFIFQIMDIVTVVAIMAIFMCQAKMMLLSMRKMAIQV